MENKKLLIALLLIKAVLILFVITAYEIHLAPDEAQYWTWSQALDWGYYSKPPAIAWQIRLSTFLFGENEFGVRIGSVVISFFISLATYRLASRAGLKERSCFWAGVVMAFSPVGMYLSSAATTDAGAVLGLIMAASFVVQGPQYLLAGLWILGGALYKWTTFLFWPPLLISFFFFPTLRKRSVVVGMLISIAALLPALYWNIGHDWATFKHVGGAVGESKGGNFGDFLGAQIGLVSPLFFVLLVTSYFYLRKAQNRILWFYAALFLFILVYFIAAFFKKMQPNWALYFYPLAMVLIAWVGCEQLKWGRLWLHLGTWLSIGLTTLAIAAVWLQSHAIFAIPYKANPFRQTVGWHKLNYVLEEVGYHPQTDFLFGDKYQTASLLSFYGSEQKRAYFFNISQSRKNQFSYWPQMQQCEEGKTGFFVVLENTETKALRWYEAHYLKRLAPYFTQVEYAGSYPLFSVDRVPVKYAIVFKCINYQGGAPVDPEKW